MLLIIHNISNLILINFISCVYAAPISAADIAIYFTPEQKCLPIILDRIKKAKSSIYVQCYSFTSRPIASALIHAYQRGVKVIVITDKSQIKAKKSVVLWLNHYNIPIIVDHKVAIAHNKIMIIDSLYVMTGSYNWTNSAEYRNAENLIVIKNEKIAEIYTNNWKRRFKKSYSYKQI